VTFNLSASSVQAILLDIEGTTSPIDFVYQVLFPFVRAHLKDYLRCHADSEELRRDLSMLREEHLKDRR
jgi:enolase-phosphatase E1